MSDTSRLEAIEIKCAHLERALQDLSDVMLDQQRQLERVNARHRELLQRMEQLADRGGSAEHPDTEPPPHY